MLASFLKAEQPEKCGDQDVVFRASVLRSTLFLILYGGLAVMVWPDDWLGNWNSILGPGGVVFLLAVCVVLYFSYKLYTGYPRIVLNKAGICLQRPFSKPVVWKWENVGPFRAEVTGLFRYKKYYACAFTDEHYDLLMAYRAEENVNVVSADILLPLTEMSLLAKDETVQRFVRILNSWRDLYGRPDIYVDPIGAEERYQNLLDRIARARHRDMVRGIFVLLMIVVFYGVAFRLTDVLDYLSALIR